MFSRTQHPRRHLSNYTRAAEKLHRSCNNLNHEVDSDVNNKLTSNITNTKRYSNWRQSADALNNNAPNCNVPNCGKILWVNTHANNELETYKPPSPAINKQNIWRDHLTIGIPQFRSSQTPQLRTTLRVLPQTPQPHEKQAFLANRRAIHSSIPLVLHDKSTTS